MAKFTDNSGDDVLHFTTAVQNLSRVGELTDQIVAMAESGKWRRYKTALGVDEWLECEFDFFLISCGLAWDDISRVLAWSHKGETLMPFMDPSANSSRRRTLEQAAIAWHAPGPETLIERARRLGWTKGAGAELRVPPVPARARVHYSTGMTKDDRSRESRRSEIPAKRRRELERLARDTLASLSTDEGRYLLDAITQRLKRGPGRPQGNHEQWAKDVAELDSDAKKLAERWGLSKAQTNTRIRLINPRISKPQ